MIVALQTVDLQAVAVSSGEFTQPFAISHTAASATSRLLRFHADKTLSAEPRTTCEYASSARGDLEAKNAKIVAP